MSDVTNLVQQVLEQTAAAQAETAASANTAARAARFAAEVLITVRSAVSEAQSAASAAQGAAQALADATATAELKADTGAPRIEVAITEVSGHKNMAFTFYNINGGSGASTWSQLTGKPFESIGDTLSVTDGVLEVNIHEVSNDAGGLTTIIG